jgi:LysR family hydrogen peroxide-inducible transcriptional activator
MELHQLRYFVAVARTGNFSRAAEQCFVSQPSLSQQISKLERHLRQQLFERRSQGVTLTDAGRTLLAKATAILAAVDDAERELRESDGLSNGRLSVGAIPTVAPYLLPFALDRFLSRHPDVELSVREDYTRNLVAAATAGELDLALIALPVEEEQLQVEPLFTEELLLALPPRHQLGSRSRITAADLREERFIVLHEMHCLGEQVLSFCSGSGCQPRIVCRSAQITTIQSLIALNQGISLLPEMVRRLDQTDGTIYRSLDEQPVRTIAVLWNRGRYHGPLAECFVADLRAVCRDLPRG